ALHVCSSPHAIAPAAPPSSPPRRSADRGCNDPHRASRNSRSSGWPRREAEVPAASSIEAATSAAVVPASSLARHTHWLVSRVPRSEEHTSELQSRENLVCRLLLGKKKQA